MDEGPEAVSRGHRLRPAPAEGDANDVLSRLPSVQYFNRAIFLDTYPMGRNRDGIRNAANPTLSVRTRMTCMVHRCLTGCNTSIAWGMGRVSRCGKHKTRRLDDVRRPSYGELRTSPQGGTGAAQSKGAAATGPARCLRVVLAGAARFSLACLRGVTGELMTQHLWHRHSRLGPRQRCHPSQAASPQPCRTCA